MSSNYATPGAIKVAGISDLTVTADELNILDGCTATYAELNVAADVSDQTETLEATGAISVVKRITKLATAAPGACTLAAPNAALLGAVKVIEMTTDNGDVTLATTNIVGSGGTTITFDAVGDAVVLVGGVAAWVYVGGSAGIA